MDLVFNIENIFSTDFYSGCLGQTGTKYYYIAPYQRGYKWSSATKNDLIPLLMNDLRDAYNSYKLNNNKGEYYLQYITVKKNDIGEYLEVIDGQQRLTTLAILFSVFAMNPVCENFTHGKMNYAVRKNVENFLKKYVFNCDKLKSILSLEWNSELGLIIEDETYNEQDIFYIFHAIKKINELLEDINIEDFYKYIKNNVKIIVNLVEPHINSEKVFRNLNSNRVELTNTELVKALLLTKMPRENDGNHRFKEILVLRATMGRQWDEISRWTNREDVRDFYFSKGSNNDSMHKLLELLAYKHGFDNETFDYKYNLFNFFQSKIKKGETTAKQLFHDLSHIQKKLNDWYNDSEIYNMLGYLFFAKGSIFNSTNLIDYFDKDKDTFIIELKNKIKELIPANILQLSYRDSNNEIHRLLLSLSVFLSNNEGTRFDFYKFNNENWSLEHIFPQNPDEMPESLGKNDISLINSLIENKNISDFSKFVHEDITEDMAKESYTSLLSKLKNSGDAETVIAITSLEKNILYHLIRTDKLNTIGNMALLSSPDNSSNGNGMFDYKRHNISKRISAGSFVPKHTFDLFSKLLSQKMTPDLTVWTENDIDSHSEWIGSILTQIKNN